jgi:hypothetical protein
VWVRIPPGAHNGGVKEHFGSLRVFSGSLVLLLSLLALTLVSGCSTDTDLPDVTSTNNQFEPDNPDDSTFTDDAGNEMRVGQDLDLPADWPAGIPTPDGRLVAVSVVDQSTAVGTWQVDGDLIQIENDYLQVLQSSGFETSRSEDLSTESITVFFAVNNDFDITVSATPGENPTDPGEITVLVNPAL